MIFQLRIVTFIFICILCNTTVVRAGSPIEHEPHVEVILLDTDSTLTNTVLKHKDPVTALALCVFMGPLGIHRIYLGTSKTTAIAYVFTGAGFGVLWITDTIFLIRSIVRKDVSLVSDNRHYFIWNK